MEQVYKRMTPVKTPGKMQWILIYCQILSQVDFRVMTEFCYHKIWVAGRFGL